MEEIFMHITTKEDCEALIDVIKLKLAQEQGKEMSAELYLQKNADTQLKCRKRIDDLKMELAHLNSYFELLKNREITEELQLNKLSKELKLIKLEGELNRQTNVSIAQKHLDLLLLKRKIQFLYSVIKHAHKRKAEL